MLKMGKTQTGNAFWKEYTINLCEHPIVLLFRNNGRGLKRSNSGGYDIIFCLPMHDCKHRRTMIINYR